MGKKRDAHGGNGDIFFSEDHLTATKYLRNNSSTEKIRRYKRELEVMQSFIDQKIPNIVEVISVDLDGSHPQNSKIVMKKYDGSLCELAEITKGNVLLSLRLLLPIVHALKTLSENTPAIYHRDLKPENILYQKNGDEYELFLTDFGICFLKDDEERLTEEITAIGARMFIAPEYETGRVENVTEKGDIFSIGKIIWWMINGIENALLPSNFWFIDDFNLSKHFTDDPAIIAANIIIASCLKINPEERCTYDQLIAMINNILNTKTISDDQEKQLLVQAAMERRNLEFTEKLTYNKLIVNTFSSTLINALDLINSKYSAVVFLQTFRTEYAQKSTDGVNYTSRNVDDDAAHYLYSKTFDDIYISINFHPASKGEKYAHITFDYSIRSSEKSESLLIKYDNHGLVTTKYQTVTTILDVECIVQFLEDLITNYIA